jgi:hypothetical protein
MYNIADTVIALSSAVLLFRKTGVVHAQSVSLVYDEGLGTARYMVSDGDTRGMADKRGIELLCTFIKKKKKKKKKKAVSLQDKCGARMKIYYPRALQHLCIVIIMMLVTIASYPTVSSNKPPQALERRK